MHTIVTLLVSVIFCGTVAYCNPALQNNRVGNQMNCGRPEVYHSPPRKGFAQTRIVGGTTAHYGAYPWQVEIQKYNRQDGHWEHRCGGTLVSDLHIVTAAHCLSGWEHEHFRVVVGDHHLDATDDKEQIHPLKEWRVHPDFQDATPYSNNIAIMLLNTTVVMSSHVSPACLPTANTQRNPGTWCVVSGWGLTTAEQEASSANTLQAAAVPLIADDDCKSEKYYGAEIRAGMMCAGFEQGEVDACGGDSGGPLTCEIKGRHVLMGAVSWGRSCGIRNKPGVYSNVLHYIEWIHKTMGELKNL